MRATRLADRLAIEKFRVHFLFKSQNSCYTFFCWPIGSPSRVLTSPTHEKLGSVRGRRDLMALDLGWRGQLALDAADAPAAA